jgi:hypothetical protein
MFQITGILFGSLFHQEDSKATILSGIDEHTGNAYDDVYIAEEDSTTIPSGSNQTRSTMNTNTQ